MIVRIPLITFDKPDSNGLMYLSEEKDEIYKKLKCRIDAPIYDKTKGGSEITGTIVDISYGRTGEADIVAEAELFLSRGAANIQGISIFKKEM
jgi:hypothetical protein